jgi:diadenosine tetraphosphatase ApaH/serine/threonine PP2A family protein phosphatase
MRKIFIGDVHGCLEELQALVAKLGITAQDEVVFVGDLLDKGPDSVGVLRFVRELSVTHKVTLVKGNHEWKHERFRKRSADTTMTIREELVEITGLLSPEDIVFLDSALGYYRTGDYLVVHGGIPATLDALPTPPNMVGISAKVRGIFEKLFMTRYLSAETGKMLPLGTQGPGDPFWTALYDGRFGRVVFGHEAFLSGPQITDHAVGIDTGCVFGGSLTALVVEDGAESFVSVPAKQTWAQRIHED